MSNPDQSPIIAAIMRDDGGESPAFCVMAAFRTEAAARAALALISAPVKGKARSAFQINASPVQAQPCPFCGCDATEFGRHLQNCYFTLFADSKTAPKGDVSWVPELIAAWNRRVPSEKLAQKLDAFSFQPVLNAVQNFDISTGRARDLLDCWVAGTLTMDMLPQCEPWLFGEDEEPREVVGKLRAALAAAPTEAAAMAATVPHEKLTHEIDMVLTDPDTKLSPGAVRALQWCRTWVSVPLQLAQAPVADQPAEPSPAYEHAGWILTNPNRFYDTDSNMTVFRGGAEPSIPEEVTHGHWVQVFKRAVPKGDSNG